MRQLDFLFVSILVIVEFGLKAIMQIISCFDEVVSILVIVEFGLKVATFFQQDKA